MNALAHQNLYHLGLKHNHLMIEDLSGKNLLVLWEDYIAVAVMSWLIIRQHSSKELISHVNRISWNLLAVTSQELL